MLPPSNPIVLPDTGHSPERDRSDVVLALLGAESAPTGQTVRVAPLHEIGQPALSFSSA
jgi:hypothetical protein